MTVSEKIVQSTLLQALARVAMAITLPVLLWGLGYIGGLSTAVTDLTTRVSLLEQSKTQSDKFEDRTEKALKDMNSTQTEILSGLATLIERTSKMDVRGQ